MKGLFSFKSWFTQNWYTVLCLGLLAFISFYPKIPLVDLIPGYIVRLRLEDLFVVAACVVFAIQLLRKRATLSTPLTTLYIYYAVVGALSILSALFIVITVPFNDVHILKMLLHFARRLEYFSLFFIFYSAIRSYRHVRMFVFGLVVILLGISAYGYGQKYMYWPVYSTMNREFSKGMRLVLTEHARVPSTFGGHYDMSAFVMFVLTLVLAVMYISKNKVEKFSCVVVFVMGFWLLILGSSRSSFLAYLLSTSILTLLVGIYKQSLWWTITRGAVLLVFSLSVMVTLGDLSSRFSQLGIIQQVNRQLGALLKPATEQPKDSIAVDPIDKTDQLPISVTQPTPAGTQAPTATPRVLPGDVYVDIPDIKTVTSTEDGKTVTRYVSVPREFSDCTYRYGLSACIRLDTLWPRAINGFIRNPIVGSGYSTLTKSVKDEFTEAESTDNDFLRNLGETGILGVIGFYGGIGIYFYTALKALEKKHPPLVIALTLGIIAGSIGMLFNALYIDVFEASKVAFMYWAVMGVGFSALQLSKPTSVSLETKIQTISHPTVVKKSRRFTSKYR